MINYLLATSIFVASLTFSAGEVFGEVSVGDPAPAFSLRGSDGKTYSNEDFNGEKVIVIAWFPKAFTGGCTKECKSLRESGNLLRGYQVAYFTASVDPAEKNADFAKSLDLDYPILSDPSKKFATELGCLNDRGMSNRWTYYIGKDNKILFIDKNVKAEEHATAIAKKLDELGVEKK
jgi:peroxiredoxin Q/BCP